MSNLKVTFEYPSFGWLCIQLQSPAHSVIFDASYIYNGFFPLVNALYRIYRAPDEAVVCWNCEPPEVEMQFNRQGDVVHLDVVWYPGRERSEFNKPEPELSVSGSYSEVCLPFWRALRNLQGRLSVAEFEAGWQSEFPTQELAQLTQALGK